MKADRRTKEAEGRDTPEAPERAERGLKLRDDGAIGRRRQAR